MTKPPRRASKGREAALGSSEVDRACILQKPAAARGVTVASAPPQIMASA